MFGSRNGINAAFVPGVAPTYPLDAKPDTTKYPMMDDCIVSIAGTGRIETTLPPDKGAQNDLVGFDQEEQDLLHRFANSCQQALMTVLNS